MILTKDFKHSPNGYDVIEYKAGDEIDGRAAEIAVKLGIVKREQAPQQAKATGPTANK
jgi:hypothetical protein